MYTNYMKSFVDISAPRQQSHFKEQQLFEHDEESIID